jgi:protein O-GlcNAc transferase
VLICLGVLCRERGDLTGSAALLEQAVEVATDSAFAWLELTRTQHVCAAWEACAQAAGETLARDQNCIEAELMNATALLALHRFEPATNAIEKVIQHLPDDAGIKLFHARCLLARKLHAEALIPARYAAALMPTSPDAQFVLGAALKRVGQNEAAERALGECLKLTPEHHKALNDLADIYFSRGDTQSALSCLRQSHTAAPFNLDAISGLCFYTAFDPHSDATTLFDLNRSWSLRLAAAAEKVSLPTPAVARPDNRIRIAYMAYDLLDHVTSWFLEPVLSRHNRDRFHVTGYYGNEITDDVTARLDGYVDSWQAVAQDTIAETAARIRRDNIDILVLASFFHGKDRRVLAYRAAPIQVGYHNRVASTGLDTVDYILTEAGSDPVGQVEDFIPKRLSASPITMSIYRRRTRPCPCRHLAWKMAM